MPTAMISFQSEFIGQPVFARYDGKACANVHEFIIDHEKGNILGIESDDRVIAMADIVAWHPKIEVLKFDVIVSPEEVARINNELNSGVQILKNTVKTESGQEIGQVIDYIVDVDKGVLSSLYVAKSLLGLWRFDKRIIPASQIIEIRKDAIIVQKNILQSRILVKDLLTAKGALKSADCCLSSVHFHKNR